MRGTGGLPPRRVDQQRQPGSGSGLAPGSASVIRARQIIVSGAGDGIFIYNGSPGLGNPPVAWSSPGLVDPYGNVLPAAYTAVAGAGGSYVQLLPGAVPQVILAPGGQTIAVQLPALYAAIAGAGTPGERYAFNLTSGYSTGGIGFGTTFFGQGAAADGSADGFASLVVATKTGSLQSIFNAGPAQAAWGVPIVATHPGSGILAETWQTMALGNGWANSGGSSVVAQYRKLVSPANSVEIIGEINGAGASSAVFFQLPSGYRAASNQFAAAASTTLTTAQCWVLCDNAGNLSLEASAITNRYYFHGFISLDA